MWEAPLGGVLAVDSLLQENQQRGHPLPCPPSLFSPFSFSLVSSLSYPLCLPFPFSLSCSPSCFCSLSPPFVLPSASHLVPLLVFLHAISLLLLVLVPVFFLLLPLVPLLCPSPCPTCPLFAPFLCTPLSFSFPSSLSLCSPVFCPLVFPLVRWPVVLLVLLHVFVLPPVSPSSPLLSPSSFSQFSFFWVSSLSYLLCLPLPFSLWCSRSCFGSLSPPFVLLFASLQPRPFSCFSPRLFPSSPPPSPSCPCCCVLPCLPPCPYSCSASCPSCDPIPLSSSSSSPSSGPQLLPLVSLLRHVGCLLFARTLSVLAALTGCVFWAPGLMPWAVACLSSVLWPRVCAPHVIRCERSRFPGRCLPSPWCRHFWVHGNVLCTPLPRSLCPSGYVGHVEAWSPTFWWLSIPLVVSP